MAGIDDKINALNFTASSSKSLEHLDRLIADAAEIASSGGGKVTITQTAPNTFTGVIKNFVRIQHGVFTVTIADAAGSGAREVRFAIGDYLRARDTLLYFIPISPWRAPAYQPLRAFSEYLRGKI